MRRMTGVACGTLVLVTLAACETAVDAPVATTGSVTSPAGSPVAAGSTGSTGSTGAATGVDDAFRARADAACRPYSDYDTANPFPFTGFDRDHPDPSVLPAVGDFFDRNPTNHTLVSALTALGEPARGGPAWHAVLAALDQEMLLATDQIARARAGDVPGFTANVKLTAAQAATVAEAFTTAGFSSGADLCAVL